MVYRTKYLFFLSCLLAATVPVVALADNSTVVSLPGVVVSKIPLEKGARATKVCYGPPNSPFVAVKGYVWDVRTGQKISDRPLPFGVDVGRLAVSPDGGRLAYELGIGGLANMKKLYVFDCRTGEIVCACPTEGGASGLLQFAGSTQVVSCMSRTAVVCDVQKKAIVQKFPIHAYSVYRGTAAISPKGRYLAVSQDLDIVVYDLHSGKPVAQMMEPSPKPDAMADVCGVAFSPDSQELAAIVGNRVVVWSNDGTVQANVQLRGKTRGLPDGSLSWLLDKSGWLIDGHQIVERNGGLPVWTFQPPESRGNSTQLVDQNHLLLTVEHSRGFAELVTTSIPWARIRQEKEGDKNLPIKTDVGGPTPDLSSRARTIAEGPPVTDADAARNADLLDRVAKCEEPVWSSTVAPEVVALGLMTPTARIPTSTPGDGALYERGTIVAPSENGPWEAKPDAPARDWEYKTRGFDIQLSEAERVVYPPHPGRFILIVSANRDGSYSWKAYDLSTGRRVGKIVERSNEGFPIAFSVFGGYAAFRAPETANECEVVSFATGDTACRMVIAARNASFVSFVGSYYFLSLEEERSSSVVRVWDVRTGKRIQCFTISHQPKQPCLTDSTIVSPGGRYLCRIEGYQWSVYDLAQARCVGRAPLPEPGDRYVLGYSHIGRAFSCDGTRLAAVVSIDRDERLAITDFRTGELLVDQPLGEKIYSRSPGTLHWLPDDSGLLFRGQHVLDSDTGEAVWTFPEARSTHRQMISSKYMLTEVKRPRGRALTCVELPEEELEKVWDAIRGGGKAIDSVLPALVQVDWNSATAMTLPSRSPDWQVTPDAQAPATYAEPVELKIAEENDYVKSVTFAAPETSLVAVSTVRNALRRYNLRTGSKSEDITLPPSFEVLDVSPTGNVALIGLKRNRAYTRLDIVRFEPREHVAGWRPVRPRGAEDRDPYIIRAAMLDDEHVLTVAGNNELVLWKLPDGKALYTFDGFGTPLAYSPSRKYMAAVHDHRLRIFECRTGRCCGEVEAIASPVDGAIFRRDGTELIALLHTDPKCLVAWDMRTGDRKAQHPLPAELPTARSYSPLRGLQWLGERYFLLDHRYLYDQERQAVVWQYHPADLPTIYPWSRPDDALWVATRKSKEAGPTFLISMRLPSANTVTTVAAKAPSGILQWGTSVRLEVRGFGEYQDEVQQRLTGGLGARGISVESNAEHRLTFTAQRGTTGEKIGVSRSWSPFAKPEKTFDQEQIVFRMSLRDRAGNELWSHRDAIAMQNYGRVRSDDAQAKLRENLDSRLRDYCRSGDYPKLLPKRLSVPMDQTIVGSSSLQFGREGPPPVD